MKAILDVFRGREKGIRRAAKRLGMEILEGRECPTVTFADFVAANPPDAMLAETPEVIPVNPDVTQVRFNPLTFASQAQGNVTSDTEESDISFTIEAGPGNALKTIDFEDFVGDTTVFGFPGSSAETSVTTSITVTITELDGTTPVVISNSFGETTLVYTNGGVFDLASQTFLNFPYEGTGTIDVDQILADAGFTFGRATKVSVQIETTLSSMIEGSSSAFIALKDAAVTVTEQMLQPISQNNALLAGIVYVDTNNNGIVDPSEIGIGNVQMFLFQGNMIVDQTTTDQFGYYQFNNLPPGVYTIRQQSQALPPLSSYIDGKDTAGTLGGIVGNDEITVDVGINDIGVGYNFGERGLTAPNVTKRFFITPTAQQTGPLVVTGLVNRFGNTTNLPLVNAFLQPTLNFNAVDFALALGVMPVQNPNGNGGNNGGGDA